jgi:hypothetical protein
MDALRRLPNMTHYLYRLIPPRLTFDQDMSAAESTIMEQHFAYWSALTEKNIAIIYGPVLDPAGVYGVAVIDVDDDAQADAVGRDDPAIRSGLSRFELFPMRLALGGSQQHAHADSAVGGSAMYANIVTTTFRTPADLSAASRELKNHITEIGEVAGLRTYLLIKTGERQLISLGAYESEGAAKRAFDALVPLFDPIVTPRVDTPPHFGGGAVLMALLKGE